MSRLRKGEAEHHIEIIYNETMIMYDELFNIKNNTIMNPINSIKKKKLISSIDAYFTAELPFKGSDILGVLSIILRLNQEKDYYEFIFCEIVRIMIPEKMKDFDLLIINKKVHNIIGEEPLKSNHVKELNENIMQKMASRDDINILIKHYVSYIAYYKFYINYIYEYCLRRDDHIKLKSEQRKLFDPVSFFHRILSCPAAEFFVLN